MRIEPVEREKYICGERRRVDSTKPPGHVISPGVKLYSQA